MSNANGTDIWYTRAEPASPPAPAGEPREVIHLECQKCGYHFEGWAKHSGVCPNDGEKLVRVQPSSVPAGTAREYRCSRCGEILYEGPEDFTVLHVGPCMTCIDALTAELRQERDALKDVVKWIASQQNLFFAECSQAEEIIVRCKEALDGSTP